MSVYYKMSFDMNLIDDAIKNGNPYIYAETSNIDEVEINGVKKGFFDNVILSDDLKITWPEIKFYYSSLASKRECDYLINVKRWPVIHKNVANRFMDNHIEGIRFYPIQLVDVVSGDINFNYYLMYVENFIDAYDMKKSVYKYNEKYGIYTFIPQKTYLNTAVCEKYDIFRPNKSVANIYVSEKVKTIIEENGYIGFYFIKQQ